MQSCSRGKMRRLAFYLAFFFFMRGVHIQLGVRLLHPYSWWKRACLLFLLLFLFLLLTGVGKQGVSRSFMPFHQTIGSRCMIEFVFVFVVYLFPGESYFFLFHFFRNTKFISVKHIALLQQTCCNHSACIHFLRIDRTKPARFPLPVRPHDDITHDVGCPTLPSNYINLPPDALLPRISLFLFNHTTSSLSLSLPCIRRKTETKTIYHIYLTTLHPFSPRWVATADQTAVAAAAPITAPAPAVAATALHAA